jgi:cytoskeletal protein RodZ
VLTSEELRVAALEASAKRGKSVAQRRVARRWLQWFLWSVLLPVIGLAAVLTAVAGFAAYEYFGYEKSYSSAQTWVQEQFGPFKNVNNVQANSPQARTDNTSMIPLTDEATPDLQIDRNLTFKPTP